LGEREGGAVDDAVGEVVEDGGLCKIRERF
jgi:hypothetical protein